MVASRSTSCSDTVPLKLTTRPDDGLWLLEDELLRSLPTEVSLVSLSVVRLDLVVTVSDDVLSLLGMRLGG